MKRLTGFSSKSWISSPGSLGLPSAPDFDFRHFLFVDLILPVPSKVKNSLVKGVDKSFLS